LKNEKSYERYGKSKIFPFLSLSIAAAIYIDRPSPKREHQIVIGDFRGRKWYYAGYAIRKKSKEGRIDTKIHEKFWAIFFVFVDSFHVLLTRVMHQAFKQRGASADICGCHTLQSHPGPVSHKPTST
jgi:hypothetical protein